MEDSTLTIIKAALTGLAAVTVALIKRQRRSGQLSTEEWLRKELEQAQVAFHMSEARHNQEIVERLQERLFYEKRINALAKRELELLQANETLEERVGELEAEPVPKKPPKPPA